MKPLARNGTTVVGEDTYVAPDPRFIRTLIILTKGFPWDKFVEFFQEKQLMDCGVTDQLFLLRLIAIQEMLCLDDDALLKWTKHQFQIISFLHLGYNAKVPSADLLAEFRTTIDNVGILAPFRKQCQKLIIMYGEAPTQEFGKKQLIVEAKNWGSQRVIGLKIGEAEDEEETQDKSKKSKWVSCPVCKSQNINKVLPPHWVSAQDGDWCRCRFCGNKFKL